MVGPCFLTISGLCMVTDLNRWKGSVSWFMPIMFERVSLSGWLHKLHTDPIYKLFVEKWRTLDISWDLQILGTGESKASCRCWEDSYISIALRLELFEGIRIFLQLFTVAVESFELLQVGLILLAFRLKRELRTTIIKSFVEILGIRSKPLECRCSVCGLFNPRPIFPWHIPGVVALGSSFRAGLPSNSYAVVRFVDYRAPLFPPGLYIVEHILFLFIVLLIQCFLLCC